MPICTLDNENIARGTDRLGSPPAPRTSNAVVPSVAVHTRSRNVVIHLKGSPLSRSPSLALPFSPLPSLSLTRLSKPVCEKDRKTSNVVCYATNSILAMMQQVFIGKKPLRLVPYFFLSPNLLNSTLAPVPSSLRSTTLKRVVAAVCHTCLVKHASAWLVSLLACSSCQGRIVYVQVSFYCSRTMLLMTLPLAGLLYKADGAETSSTEWLGFAKVPADVSREKEAAKIGNAALRRPPGPRTCTF